VQGPHSLSLGPVNQGQGSDGLGQNTNLSLVPMRGTGHGALD
jgi:hypothetical protein